MQRFLLIRLFQSFLAIIVVSIIVFSLGRLSGDPRYVLLPIDATEEDFIRIEKLWGLDKPLVIQYFTFVENVAKGDFGPSIKWEGYTAGGLVAKRTPATLQLAGAALLLAVVLAVPIGVLSAVKKDSGIDGIGKVIALLGQSLPSFWTAIVLIWIFAVELEWLPVFGKGGIKHMILPAISLGWFQVAALMRLIRSSMLDVLDSEYVKLARIKGLPEWKVIWKHSLRNAAITPLTYFGLILGSLMVGTVAVETVFSWPGLGLLAIEAVRSRDYAVIQAVVILFCGVYIVFNLLVDIAYAYLDPRIRYT